jgi:hypothetical protein
MSETQGFGNVFIHATSADSDAGARRRGLSPSQGITRGTVCGKSARTDLRESRVGHTTRDNPVKKGRGRDLSYRT